MHAEPEHEIGQGRRLGTADGVSNVDRDGNHALYRKAVQVFTSTFDTRPTRRSSSRHRTRWSIWPWPCAHSFGSRETRMRSSHSWLATRYWPLPLAA